MDTLPLVNQLANVKKRRMYKVCGYLVFIVHQYDYTEIVVYYSKSNSSDEVLTMDVFREVEPANGDWPFPEDVGYHVARISVGNKHLSYNGQVMQFTWYTLWLN